MNADLKIRFRNLQEQYSDPILTALTVLLLVLLFVVAPLQATGHIVFQAFGFLVALAMIAGALFMSGSTAAFIAMLVAFGMNLTAALHRLSDPSAFDIHLVVGRVVDPGGHAGLGGRSPGLRGGTRDVPSDYRRDPSLFSDFADIRGAVRIGRPGDSEGVFRHCDRRQHGACQQPDLFQLRDADLNRLRRCGAGASDRAQPLQSGIHHWSALSRNPARAAGHARARRHGNQSENESGTKRDDRHGPSAKILALF